MVYEESVSGMKQTCADWRSILTPISATGLTRTRMADLELPKSVQILARSTMLESARSTSVLTPATVVIRPYSHATCGEFVQMKICSFFCKVLLLQATVPQSTSALLRPTPRCRYTDCKILVCASRQADLRHLRLSRSCNNACRFGNSFTLNLS